MPVHNGVEWLEMADKSRPKSPTYSVMPEGVSRAEMNVWIDWTDLSTQLASTAFLGKAEVATGWPANPLARYIKRTNPFVHPDWPNNFYLAKSFSRVEGDLPAGQRATGTADFDVGNVAIGLESPSNGYRVLEDAQVLGGQNILVPVEYQCQRCMEIIETATVRAQSIPAMSGLRWGNANGPPVSIGHFVTLYHGEITIKWYPVPITGYNEAAFIALVGKTNNAPFPTPPPPGQVPSFLATKSTETLVMGTPAKKIIRMGNGEWAYEITLRLNWHPQGANRLWWHNPPAPNMQPRYETVVRPDGTSLFQSADYNAAFMPP